MSLFKSYFICCSVLIFWASIMLWGWGFFSPLWYLYSESSFYSFWLSLTKPHCTFIALQMLHDPISSSASYTAVSALTNCSCWVLCILQPQEQKQAGTLRWCGCSMSEQPSVVVASWPSLPSTQDLGKNDKASPNLINQWSGSWLLLWIFNVPLGKGAMLWPVLLVSLWFLFSLISVPKQKVTHKISEQLKLFLFSRRNIYIWGACSFYQITDGFLPKSSVWTADISRQ